MKFCFTLIALYAGVAQAATYYVSTSGSDTNPGTQFAPFLNISKGAAAAKAGDTVIVMNGTYGAEGQCAHPSHVHGLGSVVVLANSGNSTAGPITFKAQNRGAVVLDGSIDVDTSNCAFTTDPYICQEAWSYFDLAQNSVSYITIDGFVIQNTCVNAVHANSSSSSLQNIVIRHNEVRFIGNTWDSVDDTACGSSGCGANGIFIPPGGPSNFTIDGNIWHDIGHGPTTNLQHGIYSGASNSTIVNNIFYNVSFGYGIQIDSGSNVLIANNTFADASADSLDWGQIALWDGYGPFSGITIENNIFYKPNGAGVSPYLSDDLNLGACTVDYNLTTSSTILLNSAVASNCSIGSHNQLRVNPGLVSTASPPPPYDFHLATSSSPAIAHGAYLSQIADDCDGNTRPSGSTTDIGACIFVGDYTSNLQGWWTLNQTVNDSSGNNYNGIGQGSPALGYGTGSRVDTGSLSLNGQTQYLSVPASTPNLNMTDNLTVAFWVNSNALLAPVVLRKAAPQARPEPEFRSVPHSNSGIVTKNNDWEVSLNDGALQFSAPGAGYSAVTNSTLPSGSWMHVAITYASGSNGVVTVYINGVPATLAANNFPAGFQLASNDNGVDIGAGSDGQAGFLTGSIEDVRIYNRVLAPADVQALYLATSH